MRQLKILAAIAVLATSGITVAKAEPLMIPDLKPLPAGDLTIAQPDEAWQGQKALRFSTTTMNIGDYALDLFGGEPDDLGYMKAQQCVRFVGQACVERQDVGNFVFSFGIGHMHWHFVDYATYELRRLTDGAADLSPEGLVAGGQKVSFCMQDSGPSSEDPTSARSILAPYVACSGLIQGISPGYEDAYGPDLGGQQIVIDSVPDGVYALVIRINPANRLLDRDNSNDTSVRLIELSDGASYVDALD